MARTQHLDRIADLIVSVQRPHPLRVAIDGVDAAGKTTLADELVRPLRAYWEFLIFVDVAFEVAVARAVERDRSLWGSAAAARERYRQRYVPAQRVYLQSFRPKERADVVVKNNDLGDRRLEIRAISNL